MKVGIIGLPQSGKTALFDAVCPHHQETHLGAAKMEVRRGIVKVPDPRLWALAKIYEPQKVTEAEIEFMDVAGVSGHADTEVRSDKDIPPALREPEVFAHVVRAFAEANIVHPDGSVDPLRDIRNVEAELIFDDLIAAQARLEKVVRQARLAADDKAKREAALLEKIVAHLEAEKPLRDLELHPDDEKIVKGFQFLSLKPKLVILNIAEDELSRAASLAADVKGKFSGKDIDVSAICAKLEAELTELEETDREAFMKDLGLTESALAEVIHKAYALLGLISFFTGGEKQVRAWTVPIGTKAPQAAGVIHKDFEKGFIKAEVYSHESLIKHGSEAEAKKHGGFRVEGREYVVQDGDVILFRFNV